MELSRHALHNRLKAIIDSGNEIVRVTLNRRDSMEIVTFAPPPLTGVCFGGMSEQYESVKVLGIPLVCTHLPDEVPSTIEIKLHGGTKNR